MLTPAARLVLALRIIGADLEKKYNSFEVDNRKQSLPAIVVGGDDPDVELLSRRQAGCPETVSIPRKFMKLVILKVLPFVPCI